MPVRTVRKQRGGIKHVRVAGAAGHDGEGRDSGEQVVRVQIPAVPLTRYETRDGDFALLRLDRRLRNGDDQSSHFLARLRLNRYKGVEKGTWPPGSTRRVCLLPLYAGGHELGRLQCPGLAAQ